MIWDKDALKKLRNLRVIGVTLLIFAPLIYLDVARKITATGFTARSDGYILFVVMVALSVFYPLVLPWVERSIVKNYAKKLRKRRTWSQLCFRVGIIRLAFSSASFVYGLMIFMASKSWTMMLSLYAVGIVWGVILWPTRKWFERFMAKEPEVAED